jgi:hypothetical protein
MNPEIPKHALFKIRQSSDDMMALDLSSNSDIESFYSILAVTVNSDDE